MRTPRSVTDVTADTARVWVPALPGSIGTYCSVPRTHEQRGSEVESVVHVPESPSGLRRLGWGDLGRRTHPLIQPPNRWEILVVRQVGGRRMREEAQLVESLVRVELANHWMTGRLDEERLEERTEPVRSRVGALVGLDQFRPCLADSFGRHSVRMPNQGRAGMPALADTARTARTGARDLPARTAFCPTADAVGRVSAVSVPHSASVPGRFIGSPLRHTLLDTGGETGGGPACHDRDTHVSEGVKDECGGRGRRRRNAPPS